MFYVAEFREAPGVRGPQRLTERWCLDKTPVGPISSPSSSSSQLDTTPRPTHTHTHTEASLKKLNKLFGDKWGS